MKRLLPILALLVLATGCQLKTANFTDEQAIPLLEGRADSLLLSISLDYPVKGTSEPALAAMTGSILHAAFDMEEEPGSVEETILRYEDNLKDEYFTENEDVQGVEVGFLTWEDRINGYFSGRSGHFTTYMIEYYSYRGGIHGINTMTPLVFDTGTGEVVPEEVFFADGYRNPVAALIQAHLSEALEGDEESLNALFEPDLVGPNGNYEVTRDGVTWYYQPYDIAPFYLGVISVTVPWKELKEFVRK
jgi:hypothetical protein